jgi:hypothetical protein
LRQRGIWRNDSQPRGGPPGERNFGGQVRPEAIPKKLWTHREDRAEGRINRLRSAAEFITL